MLRFSKIRKRRDDADLLLRRLRENCTRLVFIDDDAGAGQVDNLGLELCDVYFKKQVYRDRGNYQRPLTAGRLHVQHYVDRGLIRSNQPVHFVTQADCVEKIRILWNLGIGSYPRNGFRKRLGFAVQKYGDERLLRWVYRNPLRSRGNNRKQPVVHARFGTGFIVDGVNYHRQLMLNAADGDSRFLTGKVPLSDYNRELRTAAATFSPFGYGEVCFRDFEAVLNGSVLLKPTVGHIQTWPDIYQPGTTYIPCSWEATDVSAAADTILYSSSDAARIATNAREVLEDAYRDLDSRVEQFIEEVLA